MCGCVLRIYKWNYECCVRFFKLIVECYNFEYRDDGDVRKLEEFHVGVDDPRISHMSCISCYANLRRVLLSDGQSGTGIVYLKDIR